MTADPILVLAWLVLAHLVGDFVLQNERMVMAKIDDGRRGLVGIAVHSAMIGLAMLPLGLAFGGPGWTVVGLVVVTHGLVDRLKVILTRRAEADAIAAARARPGLGGSILGPAWTPIPGVLFVLDQLVHLGIAAWAWAIFLSEAPLSAEFGREVDGFLRSWDREIVHQVTLTAVVVLALVIVNIRGGLFFVATLVHPREMVEGTELPDDPSPRTEPRTTAWRLRVGPLEARLEAEAGTLPGSEGEPASPLGASPRPAAAARGPGRAPARVGATIGVIERLLIVGFMLTGAEAAVGFVIAAKTVARFRQLDDRDFAEYYLLGTLASVGLAIATGLIGRAALGTLA